MIDCFDGVIDFGSDTFEQIVTEHFDEVRGKLSNDHTIRFLASLLGCFLVCPYARNDSTFVHDARFNQG